MANLHSLSLINYTIFCHTSGNDCRVVFPRVLPCKATETKEKNEIHQRDKNFTLAAREKKAKLRVSGTKRTVRARQMLSCVQKGLSVSIFISSNMYPQTCIRLRIQMIYPRLFFHPGLEISLVQWTLINGKRFGASSKEKRLDGWRM